MAPLASVSDRGVKYLKELKGLTSLDLLFTKVTEQGVRELKDALPNCRIAH